MQMHVNAMPVEARAAFVEAEKTGQLTREMLTWVNGKPEDKLTGAPKIPPLIPTDRDAWANTMLNNDLPDPNLAGGHAQLTDDNWKSMFMAAQAGLRGMAANKKSFADNDKAQKFLAEHFGTGKMFDYSVASAAAETEITGLITLLESNQDLLVFKFKEWGLTSSDFSYADLLKSLKDKKYNFDGKAQETLKNVAQYIEYYSIHDEDVKDRFGQKEFSNIASGFEDSNINPHKLAQFKRDYGEILGDLYKNDKALEEFAKYDKDKISGPLKTARDKISYNNKESDNYLTPKRDDELNLAQQISKFAGETYEDCLKKYTSLRGDRMYVSPDAQLIIKALDKAKIKPTEGLAKVLSEAENIKKNLPPVARKKFEYFASIMNDLKTAMPKAFAGALQNGRQLRALVSEMILHAVKNGKVEEAKVAMEVLSVIKYGYTTSKIMDALRKEKFTVFSDPGLTWNKTAGLKFVTTALDKGIKTAFLGVGYGITIGVNGIQRSRSKFNGKPGDRMTGARNDWKINDTAQKTRITNLRDQDTTNRDANQTTLDNLNTMHGINAGNIGAHETRRQEYDAAAKAYDDNETAINDGNTEIGALNAEITALDGQITTLTGDIATLNATLNDPATYAGMPAPAASALAVNISTQIQEKTQQLQIATQTRADKISTSGAKNTAVATATGNRTTLATTRDTKKTAYSGMGSINSMDIKLSNWHDATDQVASLNAQITKRDAELLTWDEKHRDQYRDLMAHWDFLESGQTKSHAFGRAKKKQEKFMAAHNPAAMLPIYNRYQMAS
jgi:hypothetical protein